MEKQTTIMIKPLNQNKMKQTAVEWLVQNIKEKGLVAVLWNEKVIEQAKEMEKEQIIEAYKYGNQSDVYFKPEQYYNETFKSE